jgi:hypothetical protein
VGVGTSLSVSPRPPVELGSGVRADGIDRASLEASRVVEGGAGARQGLVGACGVVES